MYIYIYTYRKSQKLNQHGMSDQLKQKPTKHGMVGNEKSTDTSICGLVGLKLAWTCSCFEPRPADIMLTDTEGSQPL